MNRITIIILLFVMIAIASGCKSDRESRIAYATANVTGLSGEVLLVVDKYIWDGSEGRRIESIFTTPVEGLPQAEPMFSILSVTPTGFGRLYQNHRNIVRVEVDPDLQEPSITFQTDLYAATQLVIRAAGPDIETVINALDNRKEAVFNRILQAERERWMSYYRRTQSTDNFNHLKDEHGIIMPVPAGYKIDVSKNGFAWISLETPLTTQAVLIHYFKPSGSLAFSRDSLIHLRDQLTRKEVPGPVKGTYMGIEHRFPPRYRVFKHNGRDYAELRGLWTLVNGFMGGPFVTIMTWDEKNGRAVMFDAFVYAPNDTKRDLMRQIEALIYTADFYSPQEATVTGKMPEGGEPD